MPRLQPSRIGSDRQLDVPSRRRILAAGLLAPVGALVACSDGGSRASSPAHHTASAAAPSKSEGPVEGDHVTSTPGAGIPTKAEIMERFGHRKPKRWGLNLPGEVVSVPSRHRQVALTFDACGGPGGSKYDEALIGVLRKHRVKATLNFNARWIRENPSVAEELAADPLFHIANHGVRHQPLSVSGRSAYGIKGTADLGQMYDEIFSAHDWIAQHNRGRKIFFRSGTAFSDDIGVDLCSALGMPFLGYTLNGDGGATFTPAQVHQTLLGVRAGDVVISHMNQPEHGTARGYAQVLPQLLDRGVTFCHVDD